LIDFFYFWFVTIGMMSFSFQIFFSFFIWGFLFLSVLDGNYSFVLLCMLAGLSVFLRLWVSRGEGGGGAGFTVGAMDRGFGFSSFFFFFFFLFLLLWRWPLHFFFYL
jgi:hypothetical protein